TLEAPPFQRGAGGDIKPPHKLNNPHHIEAEKPEKLTDKLNDNPPKSPLDRGTLEAPPFQRGAGGDIKPPHTLNHPHNIETEKPEKLTEKLIQFIEQAEAERIIMVIDQFEESFTLCETQEKRLEFFNCFLDALEKQGKENKFCLILGMRADFLDQCSKYPGLATQIKEHQLLVTPLEKEEIEEAIKKPAELVGMGVEPRLVAQMTEDFLRNPGSLPLLQYTLDVLWKSATQGEEKSKYLTLATYRKLGGIKGTLTKRANEVFESLSKSEKSVAKRIFLELVQPGNESINSDKITDTRRRVILENLPNEQHNLEMLLEVSDKLADQNNRLITKDKSEAGTLLDVIHEELIRSWEKLREWVEEYQEALPLERKIEADAAEWKKQGEKDDWLWREGQLIKAEEYVTKYGDMGLLDGFACEFVRESQELRKRWEKEEEERKKREFEQEQKARRLAQRRNQILGISLVLMSGVSAYALVQQRIVRYNIEVSLLRELASQTQIFRDEKRHTRSVLLGLKSMNTVQDTKKFLDSWWGKVVKQFSSDRLLDIPQNEADGAIRKGLLQLPNRLHEFQHQGKVLAVAFSPDGKTIATASDDQTTRLWDVATRKPIATLNYKGIVKKVEFSSDGKTIVTLSEDKTARLWDAVTGKPKVTLQHQGINAVAFSPDGKTIATASDDQTARLWDAATGKVKFTLEHQGIVNAVAFSRDGKNIGTVSDDNTAKVWDAVTGKIKNTIDHKDTWIEGTLNVVVFNPDGKKILTATENTVYYSDIVSGIYQYGGNVRPIKDLIYSPDGETLAVVGEDIVQIQNNQTFATLKHQGKINAVAFSSDSKIIATASDDNTTQLFDTATGNSMTTLNHQSSVNAVAFSPPTNGKSSDSHIIVTASDDKTARLWQTAAGNGMITIKDSSSLVVFSPDGKTITNGRRLWNAAKGEEVATLNDQSSVNTVAFSPDSKTIVTGGYDHTFGLWDTTTGKLIANLRHQSQVDAVAFSPDGKTIATTSYDHTARLWDAATGKEIAILLHPHQVHAVAFSPNSQTIVTGSMDGNARLW
ncbi:MAG: WD40 repeat domain-containing protein, partial [Okeania sp. SIO1H6]|nr:WD40 repeat domain-containing protein [Okeania sp. SIO1H6]